MSEFDAVDGSHPPASCCQNATGVAERLESAYGYKRRFGPCRWTVCSTPDSRHSSADPMPHAGLGCSGREPADARLRARRPRATRRVPMAALTKVPGVYPYCAASL